MRRRCCCAVLLLLFCCSCRRCCWRASAADLPFCRFACGSCCWRCCCCWACRCCAPESRDLGIALRCASCCCGCSCRRAERSLSLFPTLLRSAVAPRFAPARARARRPRRERSRADDSREDKTLIKLAPSALLVSDRTCRSVRRSKARSQGRGGINREFECVRAKAIPFGTPVAFMLEGRQGSVADFKYGAAGRRASSSAAR